MPFVRTELRKKKKALLNCEAYFDRANFFYHDSIEIKLDSSIV